MRLLVYRHCSTQWNEERRYQGRSDIDLSPAGEAAALSQRHTIPEEFSRCGWVCSPLTRAKRTAMLMGALPEALQVAEEWSEMNYGEWEGRRFLEVQASLPAEILENDGWTSLDFRSPGGGESSREVQVRVNRWANDQFAQGNDDDRIVVTHKGVMVALYSLATGWDLRSRPLRRLNFAMPMIFEVALVASTIRWSIVSATYRD